MVFAAALFMAEKIQKGKKISKYKGQIKSELFNVGTIDVLDRVILFYRGWSVYCRILSSIPGLCPPDARCQMPDASSIASIVTTKNLSRHGQMSPGGQTHPH